MCCRAAKSYQINPATKPKSTYFWTCVSEPYNLRTKTILLIYYQWDRSRICWWHLVSNFVENLLVLTSYMGLSNIMGITYANFDLVCCFFSSLANKSAMFLTEQTLNMGCIKESENVCSQGVNLRVTFNAWSSKLICRRHCEDVPLLRSFDVCGWRGKKKSGEYGLIFMNMPSQLDCDQKKQRRL